MTRGVGVPSRLKCPLLKERAKADGEIEAQITPGGEFQGSGYVHDATYDRRCHDPRIKKI